MNDWNARDARKLFAGLVPDDVAAAYQKLLEADGVPEADAASFFDDEGMKQALIDYGMATVYERAPGRPPVLDPVEPEMAIAGVLSGIQTQIAELQALMSKGTRRAMEAHGLRRGGDGRPDLAVVLTDRDEIIRISGAVINDARSDFMDLDNAHRDLPISEGTRVTGPGLTEGHLHYRVIYDQAFVQSKSGRKFIEQCIEAGQQIRWRKEIRTKMQIADTSTALVALTLTGLGGALLIRSEPVVSALREYFELLWETSHPVTRPTPDDGNDPVPTHLRPIVNLLAEGHIQKVIEESLGISEKTVRRRMDEIYNILGVTKKSLFQAGIAAHRRGWVR